jgi:hypothetical protein
LYLAWRETGIRPYRREDRQAVYLALEKAGVKKAQIEAKIGLVCIQEELEAWLLRKVTAENIWEEWICFMLTAVEKTAGYTLTLSKEIVAHGKRPQIHAK